MYSIYTLSIVRFLILTWELRDESYAKVDNECNNNTVNKIYIIYKLYYIQPSSDFCTFNFASASLFWLQDTAAPYVSAYTLHSYITLETLYRLHVSLSSFNVTLLYPMI